MGSIAEATRPRRSPDRRLYAGVGLVGGGAFLVGLGAAGAVGTTSIGTGAVVGGLAILGCLAIIATRSSLDARGRALSAGGAAVSVLSLLAIWWVTSTGSALGPAAVLAGSGYLAGLATMMAAVLASVTMPPTRSSSGGKSRSRRSTGRHDGTVTDGGTADDELSFPLDDD